MRKIIANLFLVLSISVTAISQAVDYSSVQLKEAAEQVVLLNNVMNVVPLADLYKKQVAVIHFEDGQTGQAGVRIFDSIAGKYWPVTAFNAGTEDMRSPPKRDSAMFALRDQLKLYNLLLMSFSGQSQADDKLISFIAGLKTGRQLILIVRGAPGNLQQFDKMNVPIIWCAVETPESASVCAQVVFGGVGARNKLTTSIGGRLKKGSGVSSEKIRLGYGLPESVSLSSDFLEGIDSVVNAAIAAHVTPGAVVLLAKDGQVIFDKAYGKHTYDDTVVMRADDIFDMASVTKVTATTPSIMRLYDRQLLNLDSPISRYVSILNTIPDKKEQTVREALLHEAGFTPYIKFYEKLTPPDLSYEESPLYPTPIADNFYLRKNYFRDVMWPVTLASPVLTRGKFVYSDVSMYMMKEVVENVTHRRLEEYVLNEIYLPLGMASTGYLPRQRFPKSRIVPTTENDNWVRNMRVIGYVNDPGAAMAGGVEGHAGLFSTTNDLAIYYQMLLNKGSYGGIKYISPSTVELFTSRQSKVTNRGLGFAKRTEIETPVSGFPSDLAFGHSGYTGTYVWVDPKYNLVYICLTNRVYPDDGKTFGAPKINLRARVLDLFYEEVLKSAQHKN